MEWEKHSLEIIEALAIPILVIDRNYRIIGANSSACRSFCLSTKDIVGHKCFEITHHLDKPCWHEGTTCPAKAVFELKKQIRIIHEHTYGKGTVFEQITASPIFNDHGEVDFIVEEFNDVTDLMQSKEITTYLKKDIKTLQGLLPICSKCKNIRDEKGYWNQIETYISNNFEVQFSHGMCEDCQEELYGDEKWFVKMKKKKKSRKNP